MLGLQGLRMRLAMRAQKKRPHRKNRKPNKQTCRGRTLICLPLLRLFACWPAIALAIGAILTACDNLSALAPLSPRDMAGHVSWQPPSLIWGLKWQVNNTLDTQHPKQVTLFCSSTNTYTHTHALSPLSQEKTPWDGKDVNAKIRWCSTLRTITCDFRCSQKKYYPVFSSVKLKIKANHDINLMRLWANKGSMRSFNIKRNIKTLLMLYTKCFLGVWYPTSLWEQFIPIGACFQCTCINSFYYILYSAVWKASQLESLPNYCEMAKLKPDADTPQVSFHRLSSAPKQQGFMSDLLHRSPSVLFNCTDDQPKLQPRRAAPHCCSKPKVDLLERQESGIYQTETKQARHENEPQVQRRAACHSSLVQDDGTHSTSTQEKGLWKQQSLFAYRDQTHPNFQHFSSEQEDDFDMTQGKGSLAPWVVYKTSPYSLVSFRVVVVNMDFQCVFMLQEIWFVNCIKTIVRHCRHMQMNPLTTFILYALRILTDHSFRQAVLWMFWSTSITKIKYFDQRNTLPFMRRGIKAQQV